MNHKIKLCCPVCVTSDSKLFAVVKDHSVTKETFSIHECEKCHCKFTANPPSEAEIGPYYKSEDYVSHSDTSKGLLFKIYHLVRSVMLKRKASLFNTFKADKRLLDFGSGTGYFMHHMKSVGFDVKGIEMDENAKNYSINKFNIDVKTPDDFFNLNTEVPFGYITLWHVLEHLYDPAKYWIKFHSLLAQDGYLFIALPNYKSFDASYFKSYWAAYDVPRHLWHFHPESFTMMATRFGFDVIHMEHMPFDPFYNSLLSEKYKGSYFYLLKGFLIGLLAFIKGCINVTNASSVIYVLKKHKQLTQNQVQ